MATLCLSHEVNGQQKNGGGGFPAPETLKTGDLIWPKPPGAIVPYNSRPGQTDSSDANRWEKEKAAYLAELRSKPDPTPEEKERYSALRNMSYREFVAEYLQNVSPGEVQPLGTGFVSVGHVGIIQVVNETPTVVEAMIGAGVRRLTYADWTAGRPGELIWVGRIKGITDEQRAAIAATAASFIGRPYNFWNFNLKDTSGFYCSKLAWLSILTATGFAPDDEANPKRILWFSPKQLMRSQHVEMIVSPGNYGAPVGE
jgi:hypothetical protein